MIASVDYIGVRRTYRSETRAQVELHGISTYHREGNLALEEAMGYHRR